MRVVLPKRSLTCAFLHICKARRSYTRGTDLGVWWYQGERIAWTAAHPQVIFRLLFCTHRNQTHKITIPGRSGHYPVLQLLNGSTLSNAAYFASRMTSQNLPLRGPSAQDWLQWLQVRSRCVEAGVGLLRRGADCYRFTIFPVHTMARLRMAGSGACDGHQQRLCAVSPAAPTQVSGLGAQQTLITRTPAT